MKTYILVSFLYPDVPEEQSLRMRPNVLSTSELEAILPEGSRVTSFVRVQDCERQKLILSGTDAAAVAALIENPPEPNEVLKEAGRTHAAMAGPGPDDSGPRGMEGIPSGN